MMLQLNLEQRLLLLMTVLMTALCAVGGVYIVARAKADIRGEVRSASALVQRYLRARIELAGALARRPGEASPLLDLDQLREVRHVQVMLYDAAGRLVETSAGADGDGPHAPALFARLVQRPSAATADTRMPLVLDGARAGEIVIHPDASFEIDEIWNVARGLLGLLLVFYAASMALIGWAVTRALRPLALVRAALQRLGAGHLDERLPAFSLPELASVSGEFNRTADALQNTAAENRRLTRQLIGAQEDERTRIAHELHDEIGQCITAIHAEAAAIERGDAPGRGSARESAAAIVAVAAQMKTLLRGMLQRLRPAALDELGLGASLRELIAAFRQRHAEPVCELRVSAAAADLRGDAATVAYRLVQESLTNIVRHARAQTVGIEVSVEADRERRELTLRIADDGAGFDAAQHHGGFGLTGMRERVRALGGALRIDSQPGAGAHILATLPIHARTENSQ